MYRFIYLFTHTSIYIMTTLIYLSDYSSDWVAAKATVKARKSCYDNEETQSFTIDAHAIC